MSLRAFHIFFIVLAVAMCAATGWLGWREYEVTSSGEVLTIAAVSVASGVALSAYLGWFLKRKTLKVA